MTKKSAMNRFEVAFLGIYFLATHLTQVQIVFGSLTTKVLLKKDHWHSVYKKREHIFDLTYNQEDIWTRRDSQLGKRYDENAEKVSDYEEVYSKVRNAEGTRIPLEMIPFHYFLEIVPILDKNVSLGRQWTAPGNVRILATAAKPEKTITLHALGLNISNVQVINRESGEEMTLLGHGVSDLREDQYVVTLENSLVPSHNYEVQLTFVAPVQLRRPEGLYRSKYRDPEANRTKYLVSTQLEFFNAREVFPCFDEPGLKATFDIAIGRHKRHHALANSNLVSSVPLLDEKEWFIDSFNTTVKMPTYLVAFVVSDFSYNKADEDILKDRPVKVYGPKHLMEIGAGNFGAKVSAGTLAYFEKYFDVEYPMPKMDSVAVPGFLYGAMENYGLTIYREVLLLNIPSVSAEINRYRISSVIAHENAHQFFGNLVTCKWWDNIWLNEGFATYYSYLGQNATNPEFEPMKQLLQEGPQYAFALDSSERTSYPMLLTAKTQNEIDDQGTGLPYYKGASLIRMMIGFLTPKTFHEGIKAYLKKFKHKAAEQNDLFQVLTKQGHLDGTLPTDMTVGKIMRPWTTQRGFPLVRVSANGNASVLIAAEQFKSPKLLPAKKVYKWTIPVAIATKERPNFDDHVPKFWLTPVQQGREYEHNISQWIFINPETTGYYRVLYDEKLTQLLQRQFKENHKIISEFGRSQLLDDYFAMAYQRDIPLAQALEFTKYLAEEKEEICWSTFLKYIKRLYYFYSENEEYFYRGSRSTPVSHFQSFRDYLVPRLEGTLEKLGLEQQPNEVGNKVVFRAKLLNWACRLGSKKCLAYATKLFNIWKFNPAVNPIPLDLRGFMYCYGVAAGDGSDWLLVVERFGVETNGRESYLLLRSMGCVKDEMILNTLLESTLENEKGFAEEYNVQVLLDGVMDNPMGRPIVTSFFSKNINRIKSTFNSSFDGIAIRLFRSFSAHMHTEKELNEVRSILETHASTFGSEILGILHSYIEDIEDNVKWMRTFYEPMQSWFEIQTL